MSLRNPQDLPGKTCPYLGLACGSGSTPRGTGWSGAGTTSRSTTTRPSPTRPSGSSVALTSPSGGSRMVQGRDVGQTSETPLSAASTPTFARKSSCLVLSISPHFYIIEYSPVVPSEFALVRTIWQAFGESACYRMFRKSVMFCLNLIYVGTCFIDCRELVNFAEF